MKNSKKQARLDKRNQLEIRNFFRLKANFGDKYKHFQSKEKKTIKS